MEKQIWSSAYGKNKYGVMPMEKQIWSNAYGKQIWSNAYEKTNME